MRIEHLEHLKAEYPNDKKVAFIDALIEARVPVSAIDTNDWACNLTPGVYVHNKENPFKMRRYTRCSKKCLAQALKFYLSDRSVRASHIAV